MTHFIIITPSHSLLESASSNKRKGLKNKPKIDNIIYDFPEMEYFKKVSYELINDVIIIIIIIIIIRSLYLNTVIQCLVIMTQFKVVGGVLMMKYSLLIGPYCY